MNKPNVSIVIPTYNVAKFLRQCLDSIAVQTYTDYEVIIVVDGATDGSYEIAQEFCASHEKFSVFWQENAGSGPARNKGLEKASGELVMFVDPDDWCKDDLLESLVKAQSRNNSDLTISGRIHVRFDENGEEIDKTDSKRIINGSFSGRNDVRNVYMDLFCKGLLSDPTNKLYKLSLIRDNQIEFPDMRRSQDIVFNYRYYNVITSVTAIDYSGYYYRVLYSDAYPKIWTGYAQAIKVMYSDILEMYRKWGVELNDKMLCSRAYLGWIYGYLQICVRTKTDIVPIVSDATIHHIIENAHTTNGQANMLAWLLSHNLLFLSKIWLSIIIGGKRTLRYTRKNKA